jgi:hypothetical protein
MIVAGPEGLIKNAYRSSTSVPSGASGAGGDDYADDAGGIAPPSPGR